MKQVWGILAAGLILLLGSNFLVQSQVSSKAGLAVAQTLSPQQWNDVRDGAAGDDLTRGTLAAAIYAFDGTDFDRIRGTQANGLEVDVTQIQGTVTVAVDELPAAAALADAFANPTTTQIGSFLSVFDEVATDWNRVRDYGGLPDVDDEGTGVLGAGLMIHDTQDDEVDKWIGRRGTPALMNVQMIPGSFFRTVSAANTLITQTIAAAVGASGVVAKVSAFCSAGTATVRIESPPATVIWESAPGEVGTTTFTIDFHNALKAAQNTQLDIILTACGATNIGTLMSQIEFL